MLRCGLPSQRPWPRVGCLDYSLSRLRENVSCPVSAASLEGPNLTYEHSVSEGEVEEVLSEPTQDMRGRENSRIAIGQTSAGRYLKVIYVPGPLPGACFVITAHELGPKAKRAIRRKRKGRK